jgi:hypothetical protein
MEPAALDAKTREALYAIGQYLSDVIPPVHVAEPVAILLKQPARLMAAEIIKWLPTQIHGDTRVSAADYLFHAISKLHYLGQLQLIRGDVLAPYLDSVMQILLDNCPAAAREILRENFKHVGTAETTAATPISLIYRNKQPGETESKIQEDFNLGETQSRHFSILLNRLKSESREQVSIERELGGEDPVSQLVATAVSETHTSEEFHKFQENLRSLGIKSETDQIYRTLSRSLPGWVIPTTETGAAKSHNPAIEAMGQIIQLAETRWEASKRFGDMIQTAIEQFNTGSLARAATMFDLALGISFYGKLDPESVMRVRGSMHESLDVNRLRDLAKDREKRRLLRKVLTFFHEFAVDHMLDRLQKEEKRDRRRLLLSLLEVHGKAARRMAFERLREQLGKTNVATDWHFTRNLVCILNDIPRDRDVSLKEEIELVAPLLRLSLPGPLIKEAIRFAGQTKCEESEALLISTADKLEKAVIERVASEKDPTQLISLLDRTIFALAHFGTPKGYGRVVKHGISRDDVLGDTMARLAYLSSQDLTTDRESISTLAQFIKSKMPRKLLGVTIQKNENLILHVIKALSSTPDIIVRLTLEIVASQFPEEKFGQAAAAVLEEFKSLDKQQVRAEHTLTGDLDIFGLPDLLQQLDRLQVTGALTLKDKKGNLVGTFSLLAGQMQHCKVGRLEGKEAAYQLFEKPAGGAFVFQGQRNSRGERTPEGQGLADLNSIVAEGMRRYDELQRLCAIVPDCALLKPNGNPPVPHSDEEDAALVDQVWQKMAVEGSPEECEAICLADSYRIRKLLASWVEQGLLTVE